jgi:hypothetical protein
MLRIAARPKAAGIAADQGNYPVRCTTIVPGAVTKL